ncbi:ABC transporter ATP-binding protein/permease [Paenibacillus sonchi]|nr:ABC transporter ATP-binding protein [Paenibacillus sonchi]MCE3203183.1 ABC transporter ATP-binding protein/permease [Paenibacillus sonchi]
MAKLMRFLKPYRVHIGLIFVLAFCQAMAEVYLPTLMSDIVNKGILRKDTRYILEIGEYMILVALFNAVVITLTSYISAKVTVGYGSSLRTAVFAKVQSFSLRELDQIGTASLINRTTNDITQFQQIFTTMLRVIIVPMILIGSIIMAVSKNAQLSLVFLAVLPVLGLCTAVIGKKSMRFFKAMQEKLDQLNLIARENLKGIRVIRAFHQMEGETQRFHEASKDLTAVSVKANLTIALVMPLMMLIMNAATLAVLWYGGEFIGSGSMQIGDLMAYIQYMMQIIICIVFVSMMFSVMPRARASAERIQEVLALTPDIQDKRQSRSDESGKGCIEFRNVTFSYPGAERPALRDVSFLAGPGKTLAIIGGTGSGKSALINLIPRFYDSQQGSILLDGVDIKEIPLQSLRARMGVVPQQTVLFGGTVADNIRVGSRSAAPEEIRKAAEMAQAHEFILCMEGGYAAEITQGGTNLSGGQKQRLAIARALVRRPDIYIFDDSFSALDFTTDLHLRTALKKETSAATVIIVAQRVSTVMDADTILVMDQGCIAGMGTHKELLDTCAAYKEIVSSQLSGEASA